VRAERAAAPTRDKGPDGLDVAAGAAGAVLGRGRGSKPRVDSTKDSVDESAARAVIRGGGRAWRDDAAAPWR
jgi:hypothetical protein